MADNTTTYTTVIDTQVKGTEKIENLNTAVNDSGEKFISLRRQIRETIVSLQEMADKGEENSQAYRDMSKHLKELQVSQERVAFSSKQTLDQFAALPGKLGEVSSTLAEGKRMFEVFGSGITAALGIVGLIVAAFIAMKDAMKDTADGQAALSQASEAFGRVIKPLLEFLVNVGIKVFTTVANVMDKISFAFAKATGKVDEYNKALENTKGADAAKKHADAIKEQLDEEGFKYDEITKKKLKATEDYYDKVAKIKEQEGLSDDVRQRKLTNAALQQNKEIADANKERHDKEVANAAAAEAKIEAERKKAQEAEKRELEIQLRELELIKARFKKLDVQTVGSDGMTSTERTAAYKKEQEDKKFFAEKNKELTQSLEKKLADGTIKLATETSLTIEAKERDAANKQVGLMAWLHSNKKKQLDDDAAAATGALVAMAAITDEHSAAGKAIAIAQAVINTYTGATKALADLPPPFNFAAAAAVVAAGFVNVGKIISTDVPKMGSGGSVSTAGAPSMGAVATPSISLPTTATQLGGQNPTTQIAQTLANASNQPVKAYVVQTDISYASQVQRRTNAAARMAS